MRGAIDQGVIASELTRARARTTGLMDRLSEDQLLVQVSPLMSPLVWDFAHIGYFEELWLLRELGGEPPARDQHDDVYLAQGEQLRLEVSAKFRREAVERELAAAGMQLVAWWTDAAAEFALLLATRNPGAPPR